MSFFDESVSGKETLSSKSASNFFDLPEHGNLLDSIDQDGFFSKKPRSPKPFGSKIVNMSPPDWKILKQKEISSESRQKPSSETDGEMMKKSIETNISEIPSSFPSQSAPLSKLFIPESRKPMPPQQQQDNSQEFHRSSPISQEKEFEPILFEQNTYLNGLIIKSQERFGGCVNIYEQSREVVTNYEERLLQSTLEALALDVFTDSADSNLLVKLSKAMRDLEKIQKCVGIENK